MSTTTKTFRQGINNYFQAQDTYILDTQGAGTSQSSEDELLMGSDDNQILLSFKGIASYIPSGATLESASMTFYLNEVFTETSTLREVLRDWVDEDCNWVYWDEDQGVGGQWDTGCGGGACFGVGDPDDTGGYYTVPMTENIPEDVGGFQTVDFNAAGLERLQLIVDGGNNFGWIIKQSANQNASIASVEEAIVSRRPQLEITYTSVEDPSTEIIDIGKYAVLHLPLNETTGTTVYDSIGELDGTWVSIGGNTIADATVEGVTDSALSFERASADRVVVPDTDRMINDLFAPGVDFSVSMWFKMLDITGNNYVICDIRGATGIDPIAPGLHIFLNGSTAGDIAFNMITNTPDGADVIEAEIAGTFSDNFWHHIVCVRDQGNNELLLYVDGIIGATQADTQNDCTAIDTPPIVLGSNFVFAGNHNGQLDNFIMYDIALSPANVLDLYKDGVGTEWIAGETYQLTRSYNGEKAITVNYAQGYEDTITDDLEGLPDGTYCYRSRAWGAGGPGCNNAGPFSSKLCVEIENEDIVCFPTTEVTNLRVTAKKDGKFLIAWDHKDSKNKVNDPTHFNIYYSLEDDPSSSEWVFYKEETYTGDISYYVDSDAFLDGEEVVFRVFPACDTVENPNDLTKTGIADTAGPDFTTDIIEATQV